jgi:ribosome-binding factor A
MDSIRQQKINALLKRELAIIFQMESRNLFLGRFITVTQVRITPDMGLAKVYLSIMTSKDKEADLKMIREQGWMVRKKLAEVVGKQLRKMPELAFYIDDSLDYYEQIDSLLKT